MVYSSTQLISASAAALLDNIWWTQGLLHNRKATWKDMDYRKIDESCAREVARLAVCLTNEIMERTGIKHFDVDIPAMALCEKFIRQGQYSVIAAFDGDKIVGFGALCESHSLYAVGTFGIIQEFYVLPEYRSQNIGKALIGEIVTFARHKNWKRLELCTPPIPVARYL